MHQYKRKRRSSLAGPTLERSLQCRVAHAAARPSPLNQSVVKLVHDESLHVGRGNPKLDGEYKEGAIQDFRSFTTSFQAARKGDVHRLKLLLDSNPDLANVKNQSNVTPLHYAAENGHSWCVGLLLERGATYQEDDEGATPGMLAYKNHHADAFSILLYRKAVPPEEAQLIKASATNNKQYAFINMLRKYLIRSLGLCEHHR